MSGGEWRLYVNARYPTSAARFLSNDNAWDDEACHVTRGFNLQLGGCTPTAICQILTKNSKSHHHSLRPTLLHSITLWWLSPEVLSCTAAPTSILFLLEMHILFFKVIHGFSGSLVIFYEFAWKSNKSYLINKQPFLMIDSEF